MDFQHLTFLTIAVLLDLFVDNIKKVHVGCNPSLKQEENKNYFTNLSRKMEKVKLIAWFL